MRIRAIVCACIAALAAAAPVVLPLPASAASVQRLGGRTLTIGMSGTDVFHLQVLLARRGFAVSADRVFGPQTRAAVQRAQHAYGLSADGIVGPLTLAALRAGSAVSAAGRCTDAAGPGDFVTRWAPVARCALAMLGQSQSPAYVDDVLLVIGHESGGNPAAINNWDVNALHGDPSRGLMQVIGSVFERYRSRMLPDNIYDPLANVYAALSYAIARYGSIPAIPGVRSVAAGRGYVPYKRGFAAAAPAPHCALQPLPARGPTATKPRCS